MLLLKKKSTQRNVGKGGIHRQKKLLRQTENKVAKVGLFLSVITLYVN
jgi:hypothetical protein